MKSANCISATGRIPLTERPMAEPTIRLSARGVSMTRRDPNSSWSPWVTLNTPPALPTSSPITITVSSARISSASPSWIACSRFFSAISLTLGVDALERLFGIGEGRLFRVLARLGDLRLYLSRYLLSPLLVEEPVLHQILLEAQDRVLLAPLLDLLTLAVTPVVVIRGVGGHAVGLGLDQGRTIPSAGALDGFSDDLVDGEHVVPVHPVAGEAVTLGALSYGAGDLQRLGDRDGVDVILYEEDDGEIVDAGEVHRLVPVTLAGRSLAATGEHDPVLTAHLEGQSAPGRLRVLDRDGRRGGDYVELSAREVPRHLAPAAVRVLLLPEEREQLVPGGHPQSHHDAVVAVVGVDVVVTGTQVVGRADLAPLLALAGDDERRLALAVQDPGSLVHPASEQHVAVDL